MRLLDGCDDEAIASFKTELVHRRSFRSRSAAREEVFRWIEGWYNARRRHSALGYLSPADYGELHMNERGPLGPPTPASQRYLRARWPASEPLPSPARTCPRK